MANGAGAAPGPWSWANLKGKVGGLLNDPNQMLTNPWMQAGMGILSETRKPFGGDPFGAAMGGIKSAKETKQADADRKRIEELRKQLQELIRQQQLAAMGGQAMPVPGMPGTASWQSPIPGAQSSGSRALDQLLQVK